MRKEDKELVIGKIADTLKQYSALYLVQTTGLNAEKTSALRRECFKSEVKLMVVKNTLLKKAMEQSDVDYSGLYDALKGSTSLMLSNVGNAPAKLIKKVVGKGEEIPALKAALVEECVYGADQLDALAALKSKNELIADIVALLQSPAKNVISGLQGAAGNKIHGVLETLSKR
jgi:large subunit ribosomal protein L10